MPTRRQLQAIYRKLFPGMRLRVVRKKRVRRARSKSATLQYQTHKETARTLVHRKLEQFNHHYGFSYHKVAIRDQQSRWGSCSKKGNLNFNYRLIFLPDTLADAVIVHELCHLKEFNHGKNFWALVAETIPDHRERKLKLSKIPFRGLGVAHKDVQAMM